MLLLAAFPQNSDAEISAFKRFAMSTVSAYAATSATEPLTKTTITRREPGPHDVVIDIKFCGICHSDIHTAKAEWGQPHYPVVPGHEIAGVVSAVGCDVTKYRVGDRVGVGCLWTRAASAAAALPVWSSTASPE
jgi:D-arabinose 1-dehydrogenase-like Zn-dependent alcohol dehydrogenase